MSSFKSTAAVMHPTQGMRHMRSVSYYTLFMLHSINYQLRCVIQCCTQALVLPDSSGRTLASNLAIAHSHPTWMVTRWLQQLGREQTVQLLQCNNRCAGWWLAWTWLVHPMCARVHPTSARAEYCITWPCCCCNTPVLHYSMPQHFRTALLNAATLPCCITQCCNSPILHHSMLQQSRTAFLNAATLPYCITQCCNTPMLHYSMLQHSRTALLNAATGHASRHLAAPHHSCLAPEAHRL